MSESAHAEISTMDARNQVPYHTDTGVLKLVKLVKIQLNRTPGTDSAAYQQITALDFRQY